MFSLSVYLQGLAVVVVLGMLTWLVSLYKHDVSIVDSVWPLLFLALGASTAWSAGLLGPRALLILGLLALWALRQIGWWQLLAEVGRLAKSDDNLRVRRYALGVLKNVAELAQAQRSAAAKVGA